MRQPQPTEEVIMPEVLEKSSIIGRSPTGVAVVTFENETQASRWLGGHTTHRLRFYRQTIKETEVEIELPVTEPAVEA